MFPIPLALLEQSSQIWHGIVSLNKKREAVASRFVMQLAGAGSG
jgi:hypothetical protein